MNLLICMTPLQVLIASSIINKQKINESHTGIYLTYTDNAKHRYYFDRLTQVCEASTFIHLKNNSRIDRLKTYKLVKYELSRLELSKNIIDKVYLASIETFFVQYIVSNVNFNTLITFDDGTANLFANSSYYKQPKQSLSKFLFKKLIHLKFNTIEDIKKISSLHYTIYEDEKNIIDNVKNIKIFEGVSNISNNGKYEVQKVILGQPLDSFIGAKNYENLVLSLSEKLNITFFYPHPSDVVNFTEKLEVISSSLIIEDYIIRQLQSNPSLRFELYTFFSSSILNLADIDRVEVYAVLNEDLYEQFVEPYEFLRSKGVNMINLDKLE